jgi:hypothetical protein
MVASTIGTAERVLVQRPDGRRHTSREDRCFMFRIYDWNFSGTIDVVLPALLASSILVVSLMAFF